MFLAIMTGLHALGVKDLRAVAGTYLSKARLGSRDLRELVKHWSPEICAITDLTGRRF